MFKTKIKQCTITLTRNCNLRCFFCYAKKTSYIPNEFIAFDDVKQIIDFCEQAKLKYVVLTGGEPTLYPQIKDVIKYIKNKKHKMLATIATNGLCLNDYAFCQDIIDSGLDYIDISLKGWDDVSFNEVTGCNSFSQQLAAIKNLSMFSIDFTCSMVITPYNVYSYCDAIEKAAKNGAKNFSFTFVIDNEVSDTLDEEYLIKNNPFELVNAFLSQKDRLDTITNGAWWIEYSFPICVYTSDQLFVLKNKLAAPCQIYFKNGVTLDSKKNLIPCSMNIDTQLGQFGVDFSTYKEFKKLSKKDPYKQAIKQLNELPSTQCKSCKYLKICRGGCTFFWKHCSFDSFKKFKEKHEGVSNEKKH